MNQTIKKLVKTLNDSKDYILTEEATKTCLILPVIKTLGYDVSNPREVIPEMICDIGTKKGEKIDYCININNKPIILIECKNWKENLDNHTNQLIRYFAVSDAKIGILTNGIEYRFFSDSEKSNVMDLQPFFIFNITNYTDSDILELNKFGKDGFNSDEILRVVSKLKYIDDLSSIIDSEFKNPSDELIKIIASKVFDGRFTKKKVDEFRPIVKNAIVKYINSFFNVDLPKEEAIAEQPQNKIETTEDELKFYEFIKNISSSIDEGKITYKDYMHQFSVLYNGKTFSKLKELKTCYKAEFFITNKTPHLILRGKTIDDILLQTEIIEEFKLFISKQQIK